MSETLTVYHGTTYSRRELILRKGILPRSEGGCFVTTTEAVGWFYARTAAATELVHQPKWRAASNAISKALGASDDVSGGRAARGG